MDYSPFSYGIIFQDIKTELLNDLVVSSRLVLNNELSIYFYNSERLRSTLGSLTSSEKRRILQDNIRK